MRLWHEDLLDKLPGPQILGQHRECCALRGKGLARKHATVDYVFNYSPYKLYQYHLLVIEEMEARSYKPDDKWKDPLYRGKRAQPYESFKKVPMTRPVYPEHDDKYLLECLNNLKGKGITINL